MKYTTSTLRTTLAAAALLSALAITPAAQAASRSWSKSGGDPAKAAYNVGSTIEATASTSSAAIRGDAFADVAVLGSGWKRIAYASGSVSGTKTSLAANGRVEFMGGSLWSFSKSGSLTSVSSSLPYISKTWQSPVSPRFTVGPVVVTVTPSVSVGLRGSLSASISSSAQSFTGSLAPVGIDCSAGVTASALAGLVRVNGSITVCSLSPSVTSSCSFKNRTASSNAGLNYGTLGGSIDLQAGRSWYEVTWNLMSWNGISGYIPLFSDSVRF